MVFAQGVGKTASVNVCHSTVTKIWSPQPILGVHFAKITPWVLMLGLLLALAVAGFVVTPERTLQDLRKLDKLNLRFCLGDSMGSSGQGHRPGADAGGDSCPGAGLSSFLNPITDELLTLQAVLGDHPVKDTARVLMLGVTLALALPGAAAAGAPGKQLLGALMVAQGLVVCAVEDRLYGHSHDGEWFCFEHGCWSSIT